MSDHLKYLPITAFLTFCTLSSAQEISPKIKVNQVGYLTDEAKTAYVSDESPLNVTSWEIRSSADGETAYSSESTGEQIDDPATGEFVSALDFSDFRTSGTYYIEIPGIGRSYEFRISDTVYNGVFRKVMKSFYYQRSGVDLTQPYAGKWAREAEYAGDALVYEGYDGTNILYGDHVNTAGGWRDAGDPNKKVVPAAVAVHQLLMLYNYFPLKFEKFENTIPADDDFPELDDYLAEVKVETDWLLTMQRSDGAVWHAVAQEDFYLTGMGSGDPYPRYLMPVSTTATADLAAALATAYRSFKFIDTAYANRCLEAAEMAWEALNDPLIWNYPDIDNEYGIPWYPEAHGYSQDPPGINNTGTYPDTDDSDELYWAAEELYIKGYDNNFKGHNNANTENYARYGILTIRGTVVQSGYIRNSTIDIRSLKSGTYLLVVENNDNISYGKIVKI